MYFLSVELGLVEHFVNVFIQRKKYLKLNINKLLNILWQNNILTDKEKNILSTMTKFIKFASMCKYPKMTNSPNIIKS
jgi:hypothetical protein